MSRVVGSPPSSRCACDATFQARRSPSPATAFSSSRSSREASRSLAAATSPWNCQACLPALERRRRCWSGVRSSCAALMYELCTWLRGRMVRGWMGQYVGDRDGIALTVVFVTRLSVRTGQSAYIWPCGCASARLVASLTPCRRAARTPGYDQQRAPGCHGASCGHAVWCRGAVTGSVIGARTCDSGPSPCADVPTTDPVQRTVWQDCRVHSGRVRHAVHAGG